MKWKSVIKTIAAVGTLSLGISSTVFAGTWWFSPDGEWYYHNEQSENVRGWVYDNGYWYYLNMKGLVYSSFTPDGYWVNADGVWYEDDVNKPERVDFRNLNVADVFFNKEKTISLTPIFIDFDEQAEYKLYFEDRDGLYYTGDLSRALPYGQSGLELYFNDIDNDIERYKLTMPSREGWANITVTDMLFPNVSYFAGEYFVK